MKYIIQGDALLGTATFTELRQPGGETDSDNMDDFEKAILITFSFDGSVTQQLKVLVGSRSATGCRRGGLLAPAAGAPEATVANTRGN